MESAIEIASNPSSDLNARSRALDLLSQLRSEPQGWQVCLSFVVRDPRPSEVVRHVALDIINNAIRTRQLDAQGLDFVRANMMEYIRNVYSVDGGSNPATDSANIQNKATQIITSLFLFLYATQWTNFFHDMVNLTVGAGSCTRDNLRGVRFYLRVLNSVHDEIADVLVLRTPEEQKRSNDLKDLVRERDAKMIVSSWHEILMQWRAKDATVVEHCLTAVKRWVAWTDISLIINDSFLTIMFQLLSPLHSATKTILMATETFTEIVGKKMAAENKLELIEILKVNDVISQLTESKPLRELRSTPDYDIDLAEAVAKLVNNTMYDIIKALESVQDGVPVSIRGNSQLKIFLPHLLRFLSDEYDELCSTVIPCVTDLLTLLRKKAKANSVLYVENASMLPPLLNAVIAKMKYDDTSSWGNEDSQTDEAEFQELRKRLNVLQQAIASIDQALYVDSISNVVITAFDNFQRQGRNVDWRDIDLAMHEMYLFGELGLRGGALYSKTRPVSAPAERLVGMMSKMVESSIYFLCTSDSMH